MASTTKQSKIMAKLKAKSARTFKRTREAEPSAGGRLPAGFPQSESTGILPPDSPAGQGRNGSTGAE